MTRDFVLEQSSMTSELFCLPNFTYESWVKPWPGFQVLSCWDHLPRLYTDDLIIAVMPCVKVASLFGRIDNRKMVNNVTNLNSEFFS